MNKIVPLSQASIDDAISLINAVFWYGPDRIQAKKDLMESLKKPGSDNKYWIASVPEKKVCGVIGLCRDNREESVLWVGWFGVHPEYRCRGIGTNLLKYAIGKAALRGTKTLKVYSSFDRNELYSHDLYKRYGFRETYINRKKDRIYLEKILLENDKQA